MADDKQKNADFIDRVVGDAKNPPETRMLTGWFGDSGEEGYRRLYTDAELSNYVDIPDDAILYSEPLRDTQPSGCVMVWIKRDAALKPGGSAASRAARFLQGQVQQDFASAGAAGSLEKAGLRCVTEVPCGEVTGFTGQCTKQPEVGGAWPCITAVPHCFEVTGFTGKCTHAPWPNPSRYFGCTYLHCPTNDLTHIPHICNIVASGQPGCVVINPPQGGDPAEKAEAADTEAKELPATHIPGCGYTKTWGVCETHLLGCGGQAAAQGNAAAVPDAVGAPASQICATNIACNFTLFCPTHNFIQCHPTLICPVLTANCPTRFQPQCFPVASPFCPVTPGCPFGPGPAIDPRARFGAAAVIGPQPSLGIACTVIDCGTQQPTELCTPVGCPPTKQPSCPSVAVPCTQTGPGCQTNCGPDCQTQPVNCTQVGDLCNTKLEPCTQYGNCKTNPFLECTHGCTAIGPQCPTNPQLVCTQGGPGCPVTDPVIACANPNAPQAFVGRPAPLSQVGCPASDFVACSQFGGCPTLPNGDCTFFGCPSLPQQFAAAGPGGGCTQTGPQCPTHARPLCTYTGPACPPTPATICTQSAPCPTHQGPQCPTKQFECTMFCTQGAPGCPQTQSPACFGPITVSGPQCPVHTGVNCPSQLCQSIACQSIACQPGGGGQQEFGAAQPQAAPGGIHPTIWTQIGPQCPPSHLLGCTQFTPQCRTVPNGDCTFFGCPSRGIDCTVVVCTHVGPFCPPNTAATVCTQTPQCPRPTLGGQFCPVTELCPVTPLCQVTQLCPITNGGPQCPVHTGFNCPSAIGCQSIACQSIACQPGGGGQEEFGAAQPQAAPGGIHPTIWTQIGPQCPPSHLLGCTQFAQQCRTVPNGDCTFFGCPSRGIDCTVVVCTHVGPLCPPNTAATVCTQNPQCPRPTLGGQFCPVTELCPVTPLCQVTQLCPITNGGPQCPVHTGFNCPSAIGCQSIACQSIACQPGGGGEQQVFVGQHGVPVPQQTQGVLCTQVGPQCPTQQLSCTQFGPQCPNTAAGSCTQFGALCPPPSQQGFCPPVTSGGPHCPPVSGHLGCPSALINCPPPGGGGTPVAQQAVGAPQSAATVCTQVSPLCQHTSGPTICTQIGPQCPHTAGCPTPLCTHIGAFCQHTSGPTICTQIGPQCPRTAGCPTPLCTQLGCPNTLATICTQTGPQCPPPHTQICPIATSAPQCPPASGFNCPSQFGCQSIACGQSVACVSAGCQPGGGQQAFGAAPAAAGGGGGIGVTAWDDCTHFGWQCPPFFTQFERECVVQPIFTFGPQCPPQTVACPPPPPTPFCPRSNHLVICTAFGPQCPTPVVAVGPAQQPGGGIHPTIWTQLGPQCQDPAGRRVTFVGCFTIPPFCNTFFFNCVNA